MSTNNQKEKQPLSPKLQKLGKLVRRNARTALWFAHSWLALLVGLLIWLPAGDYVLPFLYLVVASIVISGIVYLEMRLRFKALFQRFETAVRDANDRGMLKDFHSCTDRATRYRVFFWECSIMAVVVLVGGTVFFERGDHTAGALGLLFAALFSFFSWFFFKYAGELKAEAKAPYAYLEVCEI